MINRFAPLPTPNGSGGLSSGDLNALIYGALIIAFLLFEPGGLIGLARRGRKRLRKSTTAKEGGDTAEITDLSPDASAHA